MLCFVGCDVDVVSVSELGQGLSNQLFNLINTHSFILLTNTCTHTRTRTQEGAGEGSDSDGWDDEEAELRAQIMEGMDSPFSALVSLFVS